VRSKRIAVVSWTPSPTDEELASVRVRGLELERAARGGHSTSRGRLAPLVS